MRPNEYVLTLMTIISGLAMADIVVSFHRLLRARRRVRWDWLPVTAAAYVALIVAFGWFVSWSLSSVQNYNPPFWRFLLVLAQLIPLYLASAAVLPDEVAAEGLDLREFYAENCGYIWGALCTAMLMVLLAFWIFQAPGRERTLATTLIGTGFVGPALLLTIVQRRRVHALVVPLLVVGTLVFFAPALLSR